MSSLEWAIMEFLLESTITYFLIAIPLLFGLFKFVDVLYGHSK